MTSPSQLRSPSLGRGQAVVVAADDSTTGTSTTATTDNRFFIYSSKASKKDDAHIHVLEKDTNVDNFVSLLRGQVIILKEKPAKTTGTFDSTDQWLSWMVNFDAKCALSLTVDDATKLSIQSFEFHLKSPWDLVFSSSATALNSAFGPDPGSGSARVAAPGVPKDGTPLYMGLDCEATTADPTSTVGELFKFADLGSLAKRLSSVVAGLAVTLKRDKASKKRNALWFRPDSYLHTSIRLSFQIDSVTKLQEEVVKTDLLKGLSFEDASIVALKSLALVSTNHGLRPIPAGRVHFEATCVVTPTGETTGVKMLARLVYFESAYQLALQVKSTAKSMSLLKIIVKWLGGLLPNDSGVDAICTILEKDSLFSNHIYLRQLRITVDTSEGGHKLSDVVVDIEVSGAFGQGSDTSKRPTFLVTYNWSNTGGKLGSINGALWKKSDLPNDRVLDPKYDEINDLQPLSDICAASIDLVTLISGQTVKDVPANLPTLLTAARVYLSEKAFALGATVQSKAFASKDETASRPPPVDLGEMTLFASYKWGKQKEFTLSMKVITRLAAGGDNSVHQEPAFLVGSLDYTSSPRTWVLKASLEGFHASALWGFFDPASAAQVIPLIRSLVIANMHLEYQYSVQASGAQAGRSEGSSFKFTGLLFIAALKLGVTFEYPTSGQWSFCARLQPQDADATVGDIVASILGEAQPELPPFLAATKVSGKQEGGITVGLRKYPGGGAQFVVAVAVGDLRLAFAQVQRPKWASPKRLVKAALAGLPRAAEIPLVGELALPFDEVCLVWVQDESKAQKTPGLTRAEVGQLNQALEGQPLVIKDRFKTEEAADILVSAGSHLNVVVKEQSGSRVCVLDYEFKKPHPPKAKGPEQQKETTSGSQTSGDTDKGTSTTEPDSDSTSAAAPFKKKAGPLSISNIGLKYSDKILSVSFTATFDLGPVAFSLIGFAINLQIQTLYDIFLLPPALEGLSVVFEKPPLTIAGLFRYRTDPSREYYTGGLTVGWTPYQLQAAGFYGPAWRGGDKSAPFTSVFVFTRLDGPLATLEVAEISGVTGGFGYNSTVHVPTADQITQFPFIKSSGADSAESAVDALEKLTSPDEGGWFAPQANAYWAAAGMKIDAFEMIALDAVAVVQLGQSVKLGLFAVASIDVPTARSPLKYAHAELGLAVVVDLDYGILAAEAQLSPNSYVLHPDVHLTGGFAARYWFAAAHASKSRVGDFIVTLGGYHPAFRVPVDYPDPPRLGISWRLGGALSLRGEAYFATTPKVCMGGGRLRAAYHAGPVTASFDALANFLINYRPFAFQANASICVSVTFSVDLLFTQAQHSIEVGAELTLWGPPLAGRVHVDVKVTSFDIDFGDSAAAASAAGSQPVSLLAFCHLMLQTDRKVGAAGSSQAQEAPKQDEGHSFLAEAGLMNDSDKPARAQNQTWLVRGGALALVLGCKVVVGRVTQAGALTDNHVEYGAGNIYARPMRLTQPLGSTMEISIKRGGQLLKEAWGMEKVVKSVPTGLWGKYDPASDPARSGNNISALLNDKNGSVTLMTGVRLTPPPPHMSPDRLKTMDIMDASLESLAAEKPFPAVRMRANKKWEPVPPVTGPKQWDEVRRTWCVPRWDEEGGESAEELIFGGVQEQFAFGWASLFGWGTDELSRLAYMPERLCNAFDRLYVTAPLLTK